MQLSSLIAHWVILLRRVWSRWPFGNQRLLLSPLPWLWSRGIGRFRPIISAYRCSQWCMKFNGTLIATHWRAHNIASLRSWHLWIVLFKRWASLKSILLLSRSSCRRLYHLRLGLLKPEFPFLLLPARTQSSRVQAARPSATAGQFLASLTQMVNRGSQHKLGWCSLHSFR